MNIIGYNVQQLAGYKAFIPNDFPPQPPIKIDKKIEQKHTEAVRLIGKLDGVTQSLQDKDCFLEMFVRKDAASSSQIEGTNATMADAIEALNVEPSSKLPSDVDDILHYIVALNYGLTRAINFPFTLRFIRELHKELMTGARKTHNSFPGEFRTSQNWINGTRPENAKFVPPPVEEMKSSLDQWEKFLHKNSDYLILIKAAILHAQFETIHPFTDGNGRTGRMIITMFLWHEKLLDLPVLYLSSYFKKHQDIYYSRLDEYHRGEVDSWIGFFLDGIIETANSAIETCNKITDLRFKDMEKVQSFGKTSASTVVKVLRHLYQIPTVGIADIVKWTKYTPRGAYNVIEKLQKINILYPLKVGENVYGQKYVYKEYLNLFNE